MEGGGNTAISVKALCVVVVLCGWGGCCVYVCRYVVCSMYMCSVCLCLYGSVHMWGGVSACGGCAMGRQDCLHCIRVSIGFTLGQDIPTVIVERSSHWSRDSSGPFFSPSLAFWALTQQTQRRESCHLSWHAYHKKHCVASQGGPCSTAPESTGCGKGKAQASDFSSPVRNWSNREAEAGYSVPYVSDLQGRCVLYSHGSMKAENPCSPCQEWAHSPDLCATINKHIFITWSIYVSFRNLLGFKSRLTRAPLSSDITHS